MTAGLETFAKVRALHDRTDSPGEKAAAAGRMDALARAAGMTTAEAVSKLDEAASRPSSGVDWSAFTEAFRKASAAGSASDAPEAPSRRRGLPIYDPNKVECWRDVAWHCLQLDWTVPKKHGGRFLTKDERARLKTVAQYGPVTNATADWIETVLARCEAARVAWRDRSSLFQDGARPGRKIGESDVEWAARMVAAAKDREASKLDTPEPEPRPQGPAQAFAESFAEFMNRPEFVAERNEREARRRVEAAAIIERYGSEDALFEDTPMEAALRAACEPLLGPGETWSTRYRLDGWDWMTGGTMPESVRAAVAQGWPLPETVTDAWAEYEAADRLMGERCTVEYAYEPHLYVQARRQVVEEICNTLPARSLNDLRARGAWLAHQADAEVAQRPDEHRTLVATLRADIERMGERMRRQEAPVQNGQESHTERDAPLRSPDPGSSNPAVQSGHPRRPTRAERHAAIRALLAEGMADREVARRLGLSPTTVGAVRRAADGGDRRPAAPATPPIATPAAPRCWRATAAPTAPSLLAGERDLSQALWRLIVPGTPETGGPSLMGWRDPQDGPLPTEVHRAAAAALGSPTTAGAAHEEARYWTERAEVHSLLDGPGLPLWVRARRAFLEVRLDTLFTLAADDLEALADWNRLAEGELAEGVEPPGTAA